VGKQVRPLIIALLASVSLVLFAVVGIVAALPDGVTLSDETAASDEEFAFPETLSLVEHARGIPNYGYNVGTAASHNVTYKLSFDADLEADTLEYQTLLASLSPGVRATYRAWLWDRADARAKDREREAAERERDEAEYAVFIEEHLRRLNQERRSRK
jgi:hypothetical protein